MKKSTTTALAVASMMTLPSLPAHAQGTGFGYDDGDNSMTLICWGEGKRPATKFLPGYQWDKDDHRFKYKAMTVMGNQHFDSDVQIELHDGWGRIHLRGRMVPAIHSGGNRGWWDLENVVIGADRITARYRLNGMNKPRVEINRRNGRIKITGVEKFKGECHTGEFGDPRNRF